MMNVFEPLFLLLVLAALVTLVLAAVAALAGRTRRALRLLAGLGTGAAIYFAVVIAVSAVQPRRVYTVGDTQCFDDWCIALTNADRVADAGGATYHLGLRLSSRARRVPMGERGTVLYLEDARGRRYDAAADP